MVQSGSAEGGRPAHEDRKAIPVAAMVESIIGCKWSVRLLGLLADGPTRPSELLRACPGLSAKVMNERLQKMLRFGIAQRSVLGEKPPVEVKYVLTPFGRRFMGIIEEVRRLQEAVDRGTIAEPDGDRKGAVHKPAGNPQGVGRHRGRVSDALWASGRSAPEGAGE